MIAIPLATYRADPKGAMDLAERDPNGRVVVTNDDGSTYLTIAIPKDERPDATDLAEQLAEARREIVRLRATPGGRLVEAARELVLQIRGALTVEDPDEGWDEVRSAHAALESALAALPRADAGKAGPATAGPATDVRDPNAGMSSADYWDDRGKIDQVGPRGRDEDGW